MNNKKEFDFSPWVVKGVIIPVLCLLGFHFIISPMLSLGFSAYGGPILAKFLLLYLICLICAAVICKIRYEKQNDSVEKPNEQDET